VILDHPFVLFHFQVIVSFLTGSFVFKRVTFRFVDLIP
jgi:hypothetical protein